MYVPDELAFIGRGPAQVNESIVEGHGRKCAPDELDFIAYSPAPAIRSIPEGSEALYNMLCEAMPAAGGKFEKFHGSRRLILLNSVVILTLEH